VDLGEVERAVTNGDTVGHVEALGQHVFVVGATVAVPIDHGIHIAGPAGADKDRPLLPTRHRAGILQPVREYADTEPCRQLERVQLNLVGRQARHSAAQNKKRHEHTGAGGSR
jgi:hypothetical protein